MEQGDIVHERGEVNLSEGFINLLVHLTCFRYLEAVRLNGRISSSDLEERSIFNKIWDLLQMGAWVKLHFELIHCSPH